MPKSTIKAMPKSTIKAMPKSTIKAMPKSTIKAMPKRKETKIIVHKALMAAVIILKIKI
jgi:hypothetical protein